MIFQTLPALAIRRAEREPTVGHTQLPSISQSFGLGDGLGIYIDQRLPSISDLLRDVPPPPPAQPQSYSALPRTLLQTPTDSSPPPFPTSHSTWPSVPPRPRSVPGQHSGFLPPPPPSLGPRRASTDCINTETRSLSVPSRVPAQNNHYHANLEREHIRRQRRASKHQTRRRRLSITSFSSATPSSPSQSDTDTPYSPSSQTDRAKNHQQQQQQQHQKAKRNNKPYTFEQEAFIIYHRIDLDLPWEQVRAAYMARWPATDRRVGGLECAYYRTNLRMPATTAEGGLVLVDPEAEQQHQYHLNGGVVTPPATPELGPGGAGCDGDGEGEGGKKQQQQQQQQQQGWYLHYKGVAYRTKMVKCRKARVGLMERFPEELVDPGNEWVREEHRVLARGAAERRRLQREEFLAARTMQNRGVMMYY